MISLRRSASLSSSTSTRVCCVSSACFCASSCSFLAWMTRVSASNAVAIAMWHVDSSFRSLR